LGATPAESCVWDTADINCSYKSDRRVFWRYPERGRRIDGDDSGAFGSGGLVPSPVYLTLEEVITRYRGKVSEGTLRNWRAMRIPLN
jgi:hypothetical protein